MWVNGSRLISRQTQKCFHVRTCSDSDCSFMYSRHGSLRACLHLGGRPKVSEVTRRRVTPPIMCDQIKMRDYMDRRVTQPISGLPHLPGVPHLHVNRPWVALQGIIELQSRDTSIRQFHKRCAKFLPSLCTISTVKTRCRVRVWSKAEKLAKKRNNQTSDQECEKTA